MTSDQSLETVLRDLASDPALAAKAREALAVLPAVRALLLAFDCGRGDGLWRKRTAPPLGVGLNPGWGELVTRVYLATYNTEFDREY